MTPWHVFPLAYLDGILFNLNPSCGSETMNWTSPLPPCDLFYLGSPRKRTRASEIPCPKTTLTVSLTEFLV